MKKRNHFTAFRLIGHTHSHTNLKRAAAAELALCFRHFAIEDRFTWTPQTEGEL